MPRLHSAEQPSAAFTEVEAPPADAAAQNQANKAVSVAEAGRPIAAVDGEAKMTVPSAEAEDPNKVYSSTHGDGTVHSGSIPEIIEKCTGMAGFSEEKVAFMVRVAQMNKTTPTPKDKQVTAPRRTESVSTTNKKNSDSDLKNNPDRANALAVPPELLHPEQRKIEPLMEAESSPVIPNPSATKEHSKTTVRKEQLASTMHDILPAIIRKSLDTLTTSPPEILLTQEPKKSAGPSLITASKEPVKLDLPHLTPIRVMPAASVSNEYFNTSEISIVSEPTETSAEKTYQLNVNTEEVLPLVTIKTESVAYETEGSNEIDGEHIESESENLQELLQPESFLINPVANEVVQTATNTQSLNESFPDEYDTAPEIVAEVKEAHDVIISFIDQVMPVTELAPAFVMPELSLEATIEIAAQVELLTVVADRLHVLVQTGQASVEEAVEIEVYLRREYEQLLVSLKIIPTDEIIEAFLMYVRSNDYQTKEEGTHEIKRFDEQGVFAKAQQKTIKWRQELSDVVGRLAVGNIAA